MVGPTDFGDVIHHRTESGFSFRDRLRILFGGKVIIRSRIYTKYAAHVLRSDAETHVTRLLSMRIHEGEGYAEPESFSHPKPLTTPHQ